MTMANVRRIPGGHLLFSWKRFERQKKPDGWSNFNSIWSGSSSASSLSLHHTYTTVPQEKWVVEQFCVTLGRSRGFHSALGDCMKHRIALKRLNPVPVAAATYENRRNSYLSERVYNQKKPHLLICKASFSDTAAHDGKMPYEEETVRKLGWKLKLLLAAGLTYVGFNIFPLMGDSLIRHSIALVRTKDPFFKRSGASRLALIATNDRRRRSIVEAGGIVQLVKMLESASDDKTRREAVKALASLSHCDLAIEAFHDTGVEGLVRTLAVTTSDVDVKNHSSSLLQRLDKWKEGRFQ